MAFPNSNPHSCDNPSEEGDGEDGVRLFEETLFRRHLNDPAVVETECKKIQVGNSWEVIAAGGGEEQKTEEDVRLVVGGGGEEDAVRGET